MLTVIILVNALLIVTAISSISVIERKMSSRVKNTTPAFQAADSGVEWVLYKVGSITDPNVKSLADVFGAGNMAATGRYNCPPVLGGVDCEFYFVDAMGAVITAEDTKLIDIDSVRSVGRYGEDEEKASRAIEVMMEIAHCPEDFVPVGDFCIQEDEEGTETFEAAAESCADDYDARLCSAAEWITACKLSQGPLAEITETVDGDYEWVDDILDPGDNGLIIGGAGAGDITDCTSTDKASVDSSYTYRCCVNLQQ